MDFILLLLLLSFILYVSFLLPGVLNSRSRRKSNLPPGPTPLPIVGSILRLGKNPHRSLAELSKTYGPLMYLKLGSIHTVVASSPETARAILQRHDQACSSRVVPHTMQAAGHHEVSLAWLPVGAQSRKLRRISRENMLAAQKLRQLRDFLEASCRNKWPVNFEEVGFVTVLNLVSSTLLSVDSDSSHKEMKEIVQGIMKIAGTPNIADFFPILRKVDPQGLKRKGEVYFAKLLHKFDEIISERFQERATNSSRKKDMLEVLLDLNEEDNANLSLHEIKHLLMVRFFNYMHA